MAQGVGSRLLLANDEQAEIRVARECLRRGRCIVLSRDYDPLMAMRETLQPIKAGEVA